MIVNEDLHRSEWKNGRVLAVHTGADNLVRKASVLVAIIELNKTRTVLDRPIQKLILCHANCRSQR